MFAHICTRLELMHSERFHHAHTGPRGDPQRRALRVAAREMLPSRLQSTVRICSEQLVHGDGSCVFFGICKGHPRARRKMP